MKTNQEILNRVEQYKYKRGIQFADKNGKLYGEALPLPRCARRCAATARRFKSMI